MSSIKIGPFVFTVVEVERLCDEADHKRMLGVISRDKTLIQIDVSASPQMKQMVIWHEVFHEVLAQHKIELEDELEEKVVDVFALGIMEILEDNPAMRDNLSFMSLVRQI